MQNPNEDTEWNDILRSKGILPPKEKEVTEEEIINIIEDTVQSKTNAVQDLERLNLDELDELEDEEDEAVLLEYRRRRIAEMKAEADKSCYGEVKEISGEDYIKEVNKAGEDVWVVLHLYRQGIPLCTLINQHLSNLAKKFRATKFLKSISTTCIPNYPDKNLPTIFVYYEGDLKQQFVGPHELRGMSLTQDELEWILSKSGAVKSSITEDPRPKIRDVLFSQLKDDLSDTNDW